MTCQGVRPEFLLASDMDGTVIPLDRNPGRARALRQFRTFADGHNRLALAYVTGRDIDLAQRGIREYKLPLPQCILCDVGTTLYIAKRGQWTPDPNYRRLMRKQFGGHTADELADVLDDEPTLHPQEDERQAEFKLSYYVPYDIDVHRVCRTLKSRLSRKGIRANLVFSVDSVRKRGLLDVLPEGVAKDFALRVLQRKYRLPEDRVVYAGDSGNDLLAFLSGYKAIVVGNTPQSIKTVLQKAMTRKDFKGRLYFARSKYTRGVLEGCRHFGLME